MVVTPARLALQVSPARFRAPVTGPVYPPGGFSGANNPVSTGMNIARAIAALQSRGVPGNAVQPWPPMGGGGWGPAATPVQGWDVQPWPPFGGTPAGFAAGAVHPLVQALANSLQNSW